MDTQDPINGVCIGLAPKHVKILVVTIPGKGDNATFLLLIA